MAGNDCAQNSQSKEFLQLFHFAFYSTEQQKCTMENKEEEKSEEKQVKAIIWSSVRFPKPPEKVVIILHEDDNIESFYKEIERVCKYTKGSFRLYYKDKVLGEDTELASDKKLAECGLKGTVTLHLKRTPTATDNDFPEPAKSKTQDATEGMSKLSIQSIKDSSDASKECGICLEPNESLEAIGECNHLFCKECLAKHLHSEFDTKGKSFLDLLCPYSKCSTRFTAESIKKFASEETLKNYAGVLQTIPEDPSKADLSIADFNYEFNEQETLVHKLTKQRFHWYSLSSFIHVLIRAFIYAFINILMCAFKD